MTSRRFYIRSEQVKDSYARLKGEEHHHLAVVLRKKEGDNILMFDEKGTVYAARILEIHPDSTLVSIVDKEAGLPSARRITLAQAILRAKKFELLIQKATEMGISDFIPIQASRAVSRVEERIEQKLTRWNRIVRSAGKQSGQTRLPSIHKPLPIEDFIDGHQDDLKVYLCEKNGEPIKEFILSYACQNDRNIPSSLTLLCGPEGGFTDEEEEYILTGGFKPVMLGSHILRAETAALSGLSVFTLFWMT